MPAFGLAVVTSPKVPSAIRQALNIESGLNDGLALPFFVLALARRVIESSESGAPGLVEVFARSLVLAAIVGGVLGWLGGVAIGWSRDRGWVGREWSQIATVALVFLAFTIADTAQGSGFIATGVVGVTFGRAIRIESRMLRSSPRISVASSPFCRSSGSARSCSAHSSAT